MHSQIIDIILATLALSVPFVYLYWTTDEPFAEQRAEEGTLVYAPESLTGQRASAGFLGVFALLNIGLPIGLAFGIGVTRMGLPLQILLGIGLLAYGACWIRLWWHKATYPVGVWLTDDALHLAAGPFGWPSAERIPYERIERIGYDSFRYYSLQNDEHFDGHYDYDEGVVVQWRRDDGRETSMMLPMHENFDDETPPLEEALESRVPMSLEDLQRTPLWRFRLKPFELPSQT